MTTHHKRHTPEYNSWRSIKVRCFNKNNPSYKYYGGRGITMFKPWINNFQLFYSYIGDRPDDNSTIDRINNDGNYEPGNVRWATRFEQTHNRRPIKSQSGYTGITKNSNGTYRVVISIGLGSYNNIDEAKDIYRKATHSLRYKNELINYIVNFTTSDK